MLIVIILLTESFKNMLHEAHECSDPLNLILFNRL